MSDREETVDDVLTEFAGGTAGHNPAALHRVIAIGLAHEVKVLLHQQHADAGVAMIRPTARPISNTT